MCELCWVSGWCHKDIWPVSERCLDVIWRVRGCYQKGVLIVPYGYLVDGVRQVSIGCPVGLCSGGCLWLVFVVNICRHCVSTLGGHQIISACYWCLHLLFLFGAIIISMWRCLVSTWKVTDFFARNFSYFYKRQLWSNRTVEWSLILVLANLLHFSCKRAFLWKISTIL